MADRDGSTPATEPFVPEKGSKTTRKTKPLDFEVVPVCRKVKTWRLSEFELNHMKEVNATSEWFGKATCFLAALAMGLAFDIIIQGTIDEVAQKALTVIIPVVLLGCVLCAFKWYATCKSVSDFKKSLTPADDVDLGSVDEFVLF